VGRSRRFLAIIAGVAVWNLKTPDLRRLIQFDHYLPEHLYKKGRPAERPCPYEEISAKWESYLLLLVDHIRSGILPLCVL
jgi:hypothetical protein